MNGVKLFYRSSRISGCINRTEIKEKEFVFGATIGVGKLDDIRAPRDVMARASIAYQAARQKGSGTLHFIRQRSRIK